MPTDPRTRIATGRLGSSLWEMAERRIPPELAGCVRRLVGFSERALQPVASRELPVAYAVVIIELGPPLRVALAGDPRPARSSPGGFVAGIGEGFADLEHAGEQRGIQLDLTATGARRFFDLPMSEVSGRVISLRDVLPRDYGELVERLQECPDWPRRLDRVEAYVRARLSRARLDSRAVDWALAQIEHHAGALQVRELARELGISHKHLIHLFRDQVGVPPKLIARLTRFGRVMERARGDRRVPWAELAAAYGFCDQGHLAREVRHFSGLTPTEARARGLSNLIELLG